MTNAVRVDRSDGDDYINRLANNLPDDESFTMAAWVRITALSSAHIEMFFTLQNSGATRWMQIGHVNGNISVELNCQGSGVAAFDPQPPTGQWLYMVLWSNGLTTAQTGAKYWNGTSWNSVVSGATPRGDFVANELAFGGNFENGEGVQGDFAYARVWDSVLTEAQLEAELSSPVAVYKTGLRFDWPLQGSTDTSDISGNNWQPTFTGSVASVGEGDGPPVYSALRIASSRHTVTMGAG